MIVKIKNTSRNVKTKANIYFYVCKCFNAVLNEKPAAAESSTSTFTKSPEEGVVVTTELDVFTSAAQQVVTSSVESAQVKYLLNYIFFNPRQI